MSFGVAVFRKKKSDSGQATDDASAWVLDHSMISGSALHQASGIIFLEPLRGMGLDSYGGDHVLGRAKSALRGLRRTCWMRRTYVSPC